MRLLQYNNGRFTFSEHDRPPPYAILSHTWSDDNDEEVTYQDVLAGTTKSLDKLERCRDWARTAGYSYFWIDTCCIDRRNDAELAFAIRSMYKWYYEAGVCFVYLSDLAKGKRKLESGWRREIRKCRWFTRGWTLQELVAPRRVEFHARDGYLGSKETLMPLLKEVTGIDLEELPKSHQRLKWIVDRKTKRPEDMAYCLMGVCGVLMTPMYGEGEAEARQRLEAAIEQRYGLKIASSGYSMHRKSIMQQLRFEAMESRRTTISTAAKKTCRWILEHPMCVEWLSSQHSFFWIKGKPGAGKSVMVKFLDEHITKDKCIVRLSFYFTARGEDLEKSFAGMYRSLLVQLLEAAPELCDVLDNVRTVDTAQLQSALAEGIHALGRRICIFIDAVDECQDQDVQAMIDFFENLQGEAAVSVCFASRHYPVHEIPTRLQLILENAEEHSADIDQYVRAHLLLTNATPKQREEISSEIIKKANGVFLWVVIVVRILQKDVGSGRLHAVQERLKAIPPGLKELFEDILRRDQDNMPEFILCLRWILYAKRPLALPEFYFAMMAGVSTQELEWDPEAITEVQMHAFLLTSSKGFAELTKKKPVAQFIHESVRDYLIKDDGFRTLCDDSGEDLVSYAHEQLKKCCSRGLAFDSSEYFGEAALSMGALSVDEQAVLRECYPFAEYATLHILHHSNQAALTVSQRQFLSSEFSHEHWVPKLNAFQKHQTRIYSEAPSWNYLCAERNLARLIDLPHDALLVEQQRYSTPLFAALSSSSWTAARVLLDDITGLNADRVIAEAMVSTIRYEGQKYLHDSPWRWALGHGLEHLAMYLLLPVTEAELVQTVSGYNAFHVAIQGGNMALIKYILQTVPSIEHVETVGRRVYPLEIAVRHSYEVVTEFLLSRQKESDSDVQECRDRALLVAYKNCHIRLVSMLLDSGADMETPNLLQRAAMTGQREMVSLLLEKGADIESVSESGSALYAAAENGHLEVAKLLLDRGANANAQEGDQGTALQAALSKDDLELTELLLDRGANVNTPGGSYGSTLQYAIARCGTSIVELLLDRGADVNAQGGIYGSALQAACARNNLRAVKLLLDNGATVNVQGGTYGSALKAAKRLACGQIVRLLRSRALCERYPAVSRDGSQPQTTEPCLLTLLALSY